MRDKLKRILALTAALMLTGMYLITLILAFVDPTTSKDWLKASIIVTILLPILVYAMILVARNQKK